MRLRHASRLILATLSALFLLQSAGFAQFAQDTYQFSLGSCQDQAILCSDYSQQDYSNFQFYLDGQLISDPYTACGGTVQTRYLLSDLPDDGYSGPYTIVDWTINGTPVSGSFNEPQELVDLMNTADPTGAWQFDFTELTIEGGNPAHVYSNIEVFHPATVRNYIMDAQELLLNQGAAFSFGPGQFQLEARDGAIILDQATIEVTCPPAIVWENLTLNFPSTSSLCVDLGSLAGPIDPATIQFTPAPRVAAFSLGNNDCFDVSTLSLGTDSLSIRYCDDGGNCNTAYYVVTVRLATPVTPTTFRDTIPAPGDAYTFCIDNSELPGNPVSIVDICADGTEEFVDFVITPSTFCVKYRGLLPNGSDTSCIVVCDDLGICDTTVLIITTREQTILPEQFLSFTIDRNTVGSTILDVSALGPNLLSMENTCQEQSGTAVTFTLDLPGISVDFLGNQVGTERACVRVSDDEGRQQTFNLTVRVVERLAAADTLRIRNGDTRFWCFGPDDLDDPAVRLYDACPAANPRVSTSAAAGDISCLSIEAIGVGTQDMCLTLCDANNRCDVVNLHVIVTSDGDDRRPEAVDDRVFAEANQLNSFEVLSNDISAEPLNFFGVISQPAKGSAGFASDGQLEYRPNAGACGEDTLIYRICNLYGCDEAVVTLSILCDGDGDKPDLIRRGGFSPNGDGVNDTWVLRNLEFYPGARVSVFNRWGNRVFQVTDYQHDWQGTFNDNPLPDGSYFFTVETREGETLAGYIELRR